MSNFALTLAQAAPLFLLIFVGYGLMRVMKWPASMSANLTQFLFTAALPAMLFRMMSKLSQLPPVDARLLIAFFGSCFVVFVLARIIGWKLFSLDGVGQSIFGLGGVFSNNVLLGIPLAKVILGDDALPSVALVLVFNALILWTLVTVSVEWAKHGEFSVKGFTKTAKGVITNPIVAGIISGSLFGLTGLSIPEFIDTPLAMLGQASAPIALVALGMGLSEYGIKDSWKMATAISAVKLLLQPLIVWAIAVAIGLPETETRVVVMLGSLAVGANVYLMSRQFKVLEGAVAGSLVISTALSTLTTPLVLSLVNRWLAH